MGLHKQDMENKWPENLKPVYERVKVIHENMCLTLKAEKRKHVKPICLIVVSHGMVIEAMSRMYE